jgi:hypothetical protein
LRELYSKGYEYIIRPKLKNLNFDDFFIDKNKEFIVTTYDRSGKELGLNFSINKNILHKDPITRLANTKNPINDIKIGNIDNIADLIKA